MRIVQYLLHVHVYLHINNVKLIYSLPIKRQYRRRWRHDRPTDRPQTYEKRLWPFCRPRAEANAARFVLICVFIEEKKTRAERRLKWIYDIIIVAFRWVVRDARTHTKIIINTTLRIKTRFNFGNILLQNYCARLSITINESEMRTRKLIFFSPSWYIDIV